MTIGYRSGNSTDDGFNEIYFDEEDKDRIYNALFRGTNTLSPPDMELIRLLEEMSESQPVPVEPDFIKVYRNEVESGLLNNAALIQYIDSLQSALKLAQEERDAFVDLNHNQFLELEYLRPIFKAAENLLFESEEYDFNDGLGKGASQNHWDALTDALEPATDAIEEVLNERKNAVERAEKAEAERDKCKRIAWDWGQGVTDAETAIRQLHKLFPIDAELLKEVEK